ncbi:MAG: hypothetical protein UT29_C0001G0151 [Candidatus Yanofskybacteria bacterium GW2011_GWA1_39_13]|uniref:Uncharacterized protein n=1 Tax=Yanofskybacteria sp. (strain GW2011_GWA1_39_13) TaxID=1619019 RepID=A0A0G0MQF5_YANXG|nr:MAG: hypothetical protein UT29_C0001G0151 [Candidatus Yanofskybacteria bacterium GW2011_GWA1_39_13]
MVDVRPDMSRAALQSILEDLKERKRENFSFNATVWGNEVKGIIDREIDRNVKKVEDALRQIATVRA